MNEPKNYTSEEGGDWLPWEGSPIVDGRSLKKRGFPTVEICGVQVHSLKMDDGREWDCINGWRGPAPRMIALPVVEKFSTFPAVLADGALRVDPSEAVQVHVDPFTTRLAQAYALRVWSGQSPDAPRAWRIERVKLALEGQSLPFEGVVLP